MQFNNTTSKDGIIQKFEFWTSLGQAVVSSDAVKLAEATMLINDAIDELLPYILESDNLWRFDDTNSITMPIGTIDLVAGQSDYGILSDGSGNSILDIEKVYYKTGNTSTDLYLPLEAIDPRSDNYPWMYADNAPANLSIPRYYAKNGASIIIYPKSDKNITAGLKVVFRRAMQHFAVTDTTKTPGIPQLFHTLLPLMAAYEWILVNKPDASMLVTRIESKIATETKTMKRFMRKRSRDMSPRIASRMPNAR